MTTSSSDKSGKKDLDLGLIIMAPTKDKDWFKKCLIMGLLLLIPIAGWLNLSGWMRAIVERRIAGGEDMDTLPEAGLDYIGGGWRLFLAYLPLAGLMVLLLIVGGGTAAGAAVLGRAGEQVAVILAVLIYVGFLLLLLAMGVARPAMTFLHIVEGEPWSSVQFRRMWETMKLGGTQYLLLFVAALIGGMVAQLGVLACYVGMIVTIPFSQAMMGAAIAEFAKIVKPMDASFPIEGGTGGASGDPFGVKL